MTRIPIALLTDYGWGDSYVGALKAAILGINPDAAIFDITHDIPPQSVEVGAFVLSQVVPLLPHASLCVAVVDPGVGTARRPIVLATPDVTFVGPDNGLLSAALDDKQRGAGAGAGEVALVSVPPVCQATELTNPAYFRKPLSTTFHGRDLFAPVAAHISLGTPLASLGPAIASVNVFAPWRASRRPDGELLGRVMYVDHFGNLITDVREADLPAREIELEIAGRRFLGLQTTFQDGPEYVVYIGSSGYVELGRRDGSAAESLAVARGTSLLLRAQEGTRR